MSRIRSIGAKANAAAAKMPQSVQASQGSENAAMSDQFSEALERITQSPKSATSSDGQESAFYLESEMWSAVPERPIRAIEQVEQLQNLPKPKRQGEGREQVEQQESKTVSERPSELAKAEGGAEKSNDEKSTDSEVSSKQVEQPDAEKEASDSEDGATNETEGSVIDPNIAVAASAVLNQKVENNEVPTEETSGLEVVVENPEVMSDGNLGEKLEKQVLDSKIPAELGGKLLEPEQQVAAKAVNVVANTQEGQDDLARQFIDSARESQQANSDREITKAIKDIVQKAATEQSKTEAVPQNLVEQFSNAALLKQAMEVVRMARREQGLMEPISNKPSEGPVQVSAAFNRMQRSDRPENRERTVRNVPRAAILNAMEKVESALKEAARGRDGKSISLRLDPPDLGTVKIDVRMRDGALTAKVVGESSQVNLVLREKAHELQMSIRKLGLNLESVSVQVGSDTLPGGDSGSSMGSNMQGGTRSDQRANSEQPFDRNGSSEWAAPVKQGIIKDGGPLDHWVA